MPSEIRRIRFENILYATDFSPASEAALPYAVALAEHYGSTIYAAHVVSPEAYAYYPPESVGAVLQAAEEYAKSTMQKLTESVAFRDVPHIGIVKHGEIWDVLGAVVRAHQVNLIVLGTRGRRGLKKLIMGSVAEEVFRLAPCPVLTVGPRGADTPARHEWKRILLATDFSADSARAMNYAISLAEEFQAQLIVTHVEPAPQVDPNVKVRLTDFFTERLSEFVPAEAASWCTPEYVVEFGIPSEAILRVASQRQAELIVMGVRGAGAMLRTSTHFGATVHRVVTDAHCPVLTTRA